MAAGKGSGGGEPRLGQDDQTFGSNTDGGGGGGGGGGVVVGVSVVPVTLLAGIYRAPAEAFLGPPDRVMATWAG